MKNLKLVKGQCPLCGGPIPESWAGKDPSLGTTCGKHEWAEKIFGPEHIEFHVTPRVVFNPLFGKHEYYFDWAGTKIKINGRVGTIRRPQGDGDFVQFKGRNESSLGTFIKGVGYYDLLRIYKETGAETSPPAVNFEPHAPTKAPLLDQPILPVEVKMDDGNIYGIQVGSRSINGGLMGRAHELPILPMLHAFCNLFVRYKFGLAPNFACEGGFHGRDFEVRNAGGFTGGCGLSVSMHRAEKLFRYANNEKDFRAMAMLEGMIGMMVDKEEQRPGVLADASAHEVLSTWVNIMETLLRYDWSEREFDSIEAIWQNYCTMQDILANVLALDDLSAALVYAKKGEMEHAGSSY